MTVMTLAHMGQALLDECTSALGLCDVQLEVSEGHILVKKR